jgi:FkbM family methyltransferase
VFGAGLKRAVRRWLSLRLQAPSIEMSLQGLAERGFRPEVIFDVGAYRGEFAVLCRRLFGDGPRIVCFEALAGALDQLTALAGPQKLSVLPGLVGAEDRPEVDFHEMETASSVLPEHHATSARLVRHPMRRIDSVVRLPECGVVPDLLKIDTQGYEMEILKGAEQSLPGMRVILAEVNFLDIHQGVAVAHEVIGWLGGRGWVPYDICSLIRRPLDRALWQADMLFVKKDDPLRSDKRWNS